VVILMGIFTIIHLGKKNIKKLVVTFGTSNFFLYLCIIV
jgi:hypothetical protein